jgi:hypothetical protein
MPKRVHHLCNWQEIASLTMLAVSNNFRTLQRALIAARHFALVETVPYPTKARS